jgi:hypothetical protein
MRSSSTIRPHLQPQLGERGDSRDIRVEKFRERRVVEWRRAFSRGDQPMSEQTNKSTLPELYMQADRQFYGDEMISNFLKSEIWSAVEGGDPARIAATLALVEGALKSDGATVAEAAEIRHFEKRARRRGAA